MASASVKHKAADDSPPEGEKSAKRMKTDSHAQAQIDSKEPVDVKSEQPAVCPITLSPILIPARMGCGHVFEQSEIVQWMKTGTAACPMCRRFMHGTDWATFVFNKNYIHNPTALRGPFWVPPGQSATFTDTPRTLLVIWAVVDPAADGAPANHTGIKRHVVYCLPKDDQTPAGVLRHLREGYPDEHKSFTSIVLVDMGDLVSTKDPTCKEIIVTVRYDEFVTLYTSGGSCCRHHKAIPLSELWEFLSASVVVREILYQNRVISFPL